MKKKPKIAIVLVLYKVKLEESKAYQTIVKGSGCDTLIYDNSPEVQDVNSVANFQYQHNPDNPGVSKAYNEAIAWAKNRTCTHLLLLDSDSSFSVDAFSHYKTAVSQFPDKLILPTLLSNNRKISPFYFKWGKSWYGDDIKPGKLQLGNILAINSGMLIPLALCTEAEAFNEELPLDWSDVAFVRKWSKEQTEAMHIELVVQHGLSEHEERSVESIKFRYKLYVQGLKKVANSTVELFLMLLWAKLRAFKLSVKHRTFWFIVQFTKAL